MAENKLQELINGIFSRIKEKYGYTDEQTLIYLQGCQDCAEENQKSLEKRDKMLRDTVAELVEAKRLLKSAIDEWNIVCEWGNCGVYCGWYVNGKCTQEWSGKAEALKLIGSSENEKENRL
jgi:hypothetical protein